MKNRTFDTYEVPKDINFDNDDIEKEYPSSLSKLNIGRKGTFKEYHAPEGKIFHLSFVPHRGPNGDGTQMGVLKNTTSKKALQQRYMLYLKTENNKLKKIIKERQELINKLNRLSLRDYLTDLYNQRYLWKRIESELKRAQRYGESLTCMMIDIDQFKEVNDNFNHQFGDYVLKKVALILQKPLRASDILARYGGDEFSMLLPNTDYAGAHVISQKILDWTRDSNIKYNNFKARITVSIGVSSFPYDKMTDKHRLIQCADSALYKAKADGKNRVCFYNELENK